jgi:hypothetical protein
MPGPIDTNLNIIHKLAPMLLAVLLSSCATKPGTLKNPSVNNAVADMQTLQSLLPGVYSNFAQTHADDPGGPVTDINIRQLKTDGEPVFLFESGLRGSDQQDFEIYWLKLNRQSGQAEFYFTRLREDEVSLPMQDILARGWQRIEPGCVIAMRRIDHRLNGQTDPDSCVYENPLGEASRLTRALSVGPDDLTIKTELTGGAQQDPRLKAHLELQKHRGFVGWASIRSETDPQQDEPGTWQLSQFFNTRDDGRVNQLYDQKMKPWNFGLQLARVHRFEGQPPYYLLSVINLKSGQNQAYQWFEPGTEHLNFNLDWFQISLELETGSEP